MSLNRHDAQFGFTLIELLVAIGIIAILVGLLFPAMNAVKHSSRTTQCASNMRQIAAAMIGYASDNRGAYPPNSGEIQQFWYHEYTIGRYLTAPQTLTDGTLAHGVFICGQDLEDSVRSYSMNVFASSYVSSFVRARVEANPPEQGVLFRFGAPQGSSLILLAESWPEMPQPLDEPVGHAAQAVLGFNGKPGERFGAGRGIMWTDPPDATPGRFDVRPSQITFYRHRRGDGGRPMEDPRGAANFAFADGHVELLRQDELADLATGLSRYLALWSPIDRQLEEN